MRIFAFGGESRSKKLGSIAQKLRSRSPIIWALGALIALSGVPASAMTKAQCEREYVAKGAAGQTGPKKRAAFIGACLASHAPPSAGAEVSQSGGETTDNLREAAQNPVADLISVQFQNNLNFGFGPNNAAQNVLDFQPVLPIHLNDDWNLITRPVSPIVYQPRLAPDLGPEFGLGNIEPQLFLSPAHPGSLIWGVGPALYLPTATDKTLGVNAWGAGPAIVGLTIQEPWVIGAREQRMGLEERATGRPDNVPVFHQLQSAARLVSDLAADHHRRLAWAIARQVGRAVRRRHWAAVQD
jgi:hypothetical protein